MKILGNLRSAFSLVEVANSIGILSLCVLAVVGLLPVGLKSVQNANEQAAAAQVVAAIANSLRNATPGNGTYTFSCAGQSGSFSLGAGNTTSVSWTNLSMEGTANEAYKRLAARIDLAPPADATSPGTATISVAWPAAANPVWNPQTRSWSKAEGSLASGIIFLAPP